VRKCPRCRRRASANGNICLGCGDFLYPDFVPAILAFILVISSLSFGAYLIQQPGFRAHPVRVALAKMGLGPSEDAISAELLGQATGEGIVKRQRGLFAFEVDEAAWSALPKPRRDELEAAFTQKVYGREPRDGEVVRVYSGSSRRVVATLPGS
jgi:hypothetical protein